MPSCEKTKVFLLGLLDDKYVSFNFKRPACTCSPFPRRVVTLSLHPRRQTIIPGINHTTDRRLLKHIKRIQNWKNIKKYSFELNPMFFSLLWKFTWHKRGLRVPLTDLSILSARDSRKILAALKRHSAHINDRMRPGNIFLMPDREITFNRPERHRKGYARPVLVYRVDQAQVMIIPFTTKWFWMNKNVDILFDKQYRGSPLLADGSPAVENYPAMVFSKKTLLCVNAIQSMTTREFLAGAITCLGAVRKEVLECVEKRMKNSVF